MTKKWTSEEILKRFGIKDEDRAICDLNMRCYQMWNDLIATDRKNVRYCPRCEKNVHHCKTMEEYEACKSNGHCVCVEAIEGRIYRSIGR